MLVRFALARLCGRIMNEAVHQCALRRGRDVHALLHKNAMDVAISGLRDPLLYNAVCLPIDIVVSPARVVILVGDEFVLDDLADERAEILRGGGVRKKNNERDEESSTHSDTAQPFRCRDRNWRSSEGRL